MTGKKYKTIATWPSGTCDGENNISEDTHATLAQALGVRRLLCQNGFGGNCKIFPILVEVHPITST